MYTYRGRFYKRSTSQDAWPKVQEAMKMAFPDEKDKNPVLENWRSQILKKGPLTVRFIEENAYSVVFEVDLPNEDFQYWFSKLYHFFLIREGYNIEE